jgi:hypothetical protein
MKLKKNNAGLLKELPCYAKTNTLTPKLKRLLIELIWKETSRDRNNNISENVKILCESEAYIAVCKHSAHFDAEKSDNAVAYVGQIIRCSFVNTIFKQGKLKKDEIQNIKK